MRLAFLGTPDAAVPTLRALVGAGHDVRVVITRPDRKRGRGGALQPSPVKRAAHDLGLPVAHSLNALDDHELDLGVVVAYGAIIPARVLAHLPMLNVHFSLLPRWRGAAPLERAILAGDEFTGVDIMTVEPSLDTGAIHARARVALADKSAESLRVELAHVGAELLVGVLARESIGPGEAQTGEVTYAEKLTPEDFRLRVDDGVVLASRRIRLERAFTMVNGKRLRVLEAAPSVANVAPGRLVFVDGQLVAGLSDGALTWLRVQPEGGRVMDAAAWWGGARLTSGQCEWGGATPS